MRSTLLEVGEPAPWFEVRSPVNPRFQFSTVAGRYVVLYFFASAAEPASRRILDDIFQHRALFGDETFCFFGVSIDPGDEQEARIKEIRPGMHLFWDFDCRISRIYGALGERTVNDAAQSLVPSRVR